jgi:hypothetical protein
VSLTPLGWRLDSGGVGNSMVAWYNAVLSNASAIIRDNRSVVTLDMMDIEAANWSKLTSKYSDGCQSRPK